MVAIGSLGAIPLLARRWLVESVKKRVISEMSANLLFKIALQ